MIAKKKTSIKAKSTPAALKKTISRKDDSINLASVITMQQVKEMIALMKDAGHFKTFSYKTAEFEIGIEVSKSSTNDGDDVKDTPPTQPVLQKKVQASSGEPIKHHSNEKIVNRDGFWEILSPMVGTFYRRPNPSSLPFVNIGDRVEHDAPVCIVEVMKLLTTVTAEKSGRIVEICVEDGASIEAGQLLMIVELT